MADSKGERWGLPLSSFKMSGSATAIVSSRLGMAALNNYRWKYYEKASFFCARDVYQSLLGETLCVLSVNVCSVFAC